MNNQNPGKRNKAKTDLRNISNAIAIARRLYDHGQLNESIDIYEQIFDGFNTYDPEHYSIMTNILEELFYCYCRFPSKDRFTLYQSRFYNFGVKQQDRVLDIGSGNNPLPFATHMAEISIEDNYVGRAGASFMHVKGLPLIVCNVENLPFRDKSFDFVYCSHVLEHVDNPDKACKEIMRIGKRGYIETPTKGKDLWLNYPRVSNHKWNVELYDDKLIFKEYTEEDKSGINCDVINRMYDLPQNKTERAVSALINLKADILNTMHLWSDNFSYEVLNSSKALQKTKPGIVLEKGVSVVIPTHNRAASIERALKSVQEQSHPVSEIIIIDDNSTDCTGDILEKMKKADDRITIIRHEKRLGAQTARNNGIRAARNEWIAFLDSDDVWLSHKIEKQLLLASRDGHPIVHSECLVENETTGARYPFGLTYPSGDIYKQVLSHPGPMFQGLLVRKECLEAIGLLDENVPSYQEWDTAIRLARYYTFGFIHEQLFIYFIHSGDMISKDPRPEADGWAYIVNKYSDDIRMIAGDQALINHYLILMSKYKVIGDSEKEIFYSSTVETILSNLNESVTPPFQNATAEEIAHQKALDHMEKAKVHMNNRDFHLALTELDKAMYLFPCINNLHFFRSVCLHMVGRVAESRISAQAELSYNPDNEQCRFFMERNFTSNVS